MRDLSLTERIYIYSLLAPNHWRCVFIFPFSSRYDSQYIDRVAIPEFKRINRELHAVFRYVGTLSFICPEEKPEEKLNENGPSNSVGSLASEPTQLISSELKSPRGDYDDYLRLLRAEFDLQVLSSHFFYFSQNPFPFSLSHVTSQQYPFALNHSTVLLLVSKDFRDKEKGTYVL